MGILRKWMSVFLAVSFLMAPALRAMAEEGNAGSTMERSTASKHSGKKKKKKKKSKHAGKQRKSKKHKTNAQSHYPTTQSAGAGGFDNVPNEKKDNLPAPAAPKE